MFGFEESSKHTNYKDDYINKKADAVQPVNQKKVNVDLGDSLTDFATSYNRAFEGGQGGRPEKVNNNNRASNLTLGYDNSNYLTSQGATHNQKPVESYKQVSRTYGDNILLGDNQLAFDS